jgi:predicted pyridoxine 5'-phosphate oxidase superfamily flavin-nucleotide-binding protein
MPDNSVLVFTPSARCAQAERGSAKAYERKTATGFPDRVTPEFAQFLTGIDTAFLGTVSDEKTLGFADYRGNRQYITLGNLKDNDRAFLFLLNPATQQRIKVWGHARVVENDPDLIARLFDAGYQARPERVILFSIDAWDVNCSQHIAPRLTPEEIAEAASELRARIAALEAENRELREALGRTSPTA